MLIPFTSIRIVIENENMQWIVSVGIHRLTKHTYIFIRTYGYTNPPGEEETQGEVTKMRVAARSLSH